jgi:hypothetical protein
MSPTAIRLKTVPVDNPSWAAARGANTNNNHHVHPLLTCIAEGGCTRRSSHTRCFLNWVVSGNGILDAVYRLCTTELSKKGPKTTILTPIGRVDCVVYAVRPTGVCWPLLWCGANPQLRKLCAVPPTSVTPMAAGGEHIDKLDKWIEKLMDCKRLTEGEVKELCDRVCCASCCRPTG